MREKIILCIALVCILVYAAAIGFGAFQIYDNIQEQSALSKTEYAYLKNLSVFTAQGLGFMSEAYKAEMSKALFATKTVQALIISGSNSTFALERRNGIISIVNGDPRIQENPALTQHNEALQIEGIRNPYINMTADLFDHTFFLITLKNTLLIVLGALAVVFLTFIAESLAVKTQTISDTVKPPFAEEDENKVFFHHDEETCDFEIPPMDIESHATEMISDEDEFIQDEKISDDTFDIRSEDLSSDSLDDIHTDEKICDGPQGLYSPHGNISWEAYTKDRLTSELHRCASYEQDMVFIIMEFRGDKQNDREFFNAFTEMAVNFFGHRDMIFEWKEDGISIIVPNIDVDQGVAKCEDFHNRVKTKLLHSSSLEWELCMGLSSRAGRLIDPDRIIFETSQAVERALVDPVSPIIAFKSNPEKYRAFIAAQNSEEHKA
ncbi:MAG: hypothetical protein LBV20_00880 [Treponema sp.]|jgi:hypothetical protein|nr:hypothetical protein [Treponema sp.]